MLPMTVFKIEEIKDSIELVAEQVYRANDKNEVERELRGSLAISAGSYSVKARHYFSTLELRKFHDSLKNCYETLGGSACLENKENMLKLSCEFDRRGHVLISGYFQEHLSSANCLHFEIPTDQTQIGHMLDSIDRVLSAVN